MKFAIIGSGFVGSAVSEVVSKFHEVVIHDPPKEQFVDFEKTPLDGIIICVPTPSSEDGSCDDSLVYDYYVMIRALNYSIPIMIKSTTSVETLDMMDRLQDPHLVFSPEFLTASNAVNDFQNPNFVIMSGYGLGCSLFWGEHIFRKFIQNHETIFYMDKMSDAGFVKYTINSFLALKVSFFNEMYRLYHEAGFGTDFNSVTEAVSMDPRMGTSHMQVPGPDGAFGWGGACFPKDTSEILSFAERMNTPLQVLSKACEVNMEHRNNGQ